MSEQESSPEEQLLVFTGITPEKLSKITELMDESIVRDQRASPKVQQIMELGFTKEEAQKINETYFNFYLYADQVEEIIQLIDHSNLRTNEKNMLKQVYETVRKKADREKIAIIQEAEEVSDYGHQHLHSLSAASEFRPILKNGKVVKMVPSIVITGRIHNPNTNEESVINFQTDIRGLEKMIDVLTREFNDVKIEIKDLKQRLGDNIVD